jgi:hypothetical protein
MSDPTLVAIPYRHYSGRLWRLACSVCGPLVERRRSVEDVVPIARAHAHLRHGGRGRLVNADELLPTTRRS